MERQFKILEWFEQNWPTYKKDIPFPTSFGTRHGYGIAFSIDVFHVLFAAVRGKRGSITGVLIVKDISQSVLIEKLLCGNLRILRSEDPITPLSTLVHYDKKNFDEVAPRYLTETISEWKNDPKRLVSIAALVGFGDTSVLALQGGAVSPR